MKMSFDTIKIDGGKLRSCILAKGISVNEASHRIGYTKVLQQTIYRNLITRPVMMLTESVLGIPLDDYKLDEPKLETPKQDSSLTAELIERTVYDATVYATTYAVEKYMNEHLASAIEEAIRKVVG